MEILNRILVLLGNREQQELTDFLGLKKTAFSDWKSGKSNSYKKYLIEIALFFNVSIDYLVYGKETIVFNDKQKELFDFYNQMNEDEQDFIIEKARTIIELKYRNNSKEDVG